MQEICFLPQELNQELKIKSGTNSDTKNSQELTQILKPISRTKSSSRDTKLRTLLQISIPIFIEIGERNPEQSCPIQTSIDLKALAERDVLFKKN